MSINRKHAIEFLGYYRDEILARQKSIIEIDRVSGELIWAEQVNQMIEKLRRHEAAEEAHANWVKASQQADQGHTEGKSDNDN